MVTQLGGALCCEKGFFRRGIKLTEMDGKEFPSLINANIVKKYYAWDNKGSNLSELKTWEGGSDRKKWKKNRKKMEKV